MARLMVVPIQDRGDAVLIVSQHAGVTLMGFVVNATLSGVLRRSLSNCECMAIVERHLPRFEAILARKTAEADYIETSIACVEITADELSGVRQALTEP
jgi:hypothetical protein